MAVVQHCKDEVRLQQCANTIALMARNLSKDSKVRLLILGSSVCLFEGPSIFSSYLQAVFNLLSQQPYQLSHIFRQTDGAQHFSSCYLICYYFQFLSPFAVNALAAGIETEGGKPDDITVLLATVSL